jgi:hypothetical protein
LDSCVVFRVSVEWRFMVFWLGIFIIQFFG